MVLGVQGWRDGVDEARESGWLLLLLQVHRCGGGGGCWYGRNMSGRDCGDGGTGVVESGYMACIYIPELPRRESKV